MNLGLSDKRAVVLASTAGLGLAVAEELLQEGACVALCGRDEARLKQALERLSRDHGERVFGGVVDVTDKEALAAHLHRVKDRWDRVDILIVNSGGPPLGPAARITDESLDAAYDLLLRSAIRAISIVLPWMRERQWGRIIALTSMAVREPIANLALSNVMRAGLTGYLKTLAGEVAGDGVLVNSVCTGMFLTERLLDLARARAKASGQSVEAVMNGMAGQIPLKRAGDPKEFAALVVFMASERASFLTGAAIPLDGGAARAAL